MVRLSKVSLASIAIVVGAVLTAIGGFAYGQGNSTLNLVGFFYGFPLLLIGAALKSAELKPVPFLSAPTPEIIRLREQQATAIQKQVRQDVTVYRYGVSAHLEQALEKLGLGKLTAERPVLTGIYETVTDQAYDLVLRFNSPSVPLSTWQEKLDKISRFFGPQVRAEVQLVGENLVDLHLIRTQP
ncbi:MAG: DUF2854 domain-containing protein [Pseudanabaenaceae cyanobacterium]